MLARLAVLHRQRTLDERRRLYEDAGRIIEREIASSTLSLQTIADELGVSARQLQRVFRQIGGTTYRDALLKARMEVAAALLSEDRLRRAVPLRPVHEVAAMVGYSQPAGFAKAFRRYWGRPPHRMRRTTAEGD